MWWYLIVAIWSTGLMYEFVSNNYEWFDYPSVPANISIIVFMSALWPIFLTCIVFSFIEKKLKSK